MSNQPSAKKILFLVRPALPSNWIMGFYPQPYHCVRVVVVLIYALVYVKQTRTGTRSL